MSEKTRKYDSTVARIAGNIAAGLVKNYREINDEHAIAEEAVSLARAIVAEVERTEPVAAAVIHDSGPDVSDICAGCGKSYGRHANEYCEWPSTARTFRTQMKAGAAAAIAREA